MTRFVFPAKIIITVKGRRKTSWKAASLRMFLDCSSTRLMSIRAPHQEFWPRVSRRVRVYEAKWRRAKRNTGTSTSVMGAAYRNSTQNIK